MILKPHLINGSLKSHSPASTISNTHTKDAHQPFQQQQPPNDIFKIVSAKQTGNSFIKNLNLSESLYPHKISKRNKDSDPEDEQNLLNKTSETHVSDLVFPRYTFSGEKKSNKLMKIITSPSPDKRESNPLSLDLKKLLNPREIRKSQATSQFQNVVNKIDKRSTSNLSPSFNKSQLKEETHSFAFSDFDQFVEIVSQSTSRYNKVHHLQDLVHKIKPSPEYSRDSAFKKHSRSVSPNEGSFSRSPVDQQYSDFITMKRRDNGGRTRSTTTEEKARKSSNVFTNKSVFPSFDHSPTRMGYTMTPGDISGEKNPQSFEEYLNDHGVGISLFSHNITAETPAPTKILTINEGVHHFSQHQQPQQPGILNELTTDSKISQAHNNGVFISNESQNNDMLASLQFFLRENLKEMGEIKNILKEQGSPVNNKSPEEQSQIIDAKIKPFIFEKDQDDKLQRELIKLASRIQELEKENALLQMNTQSTQANTNNTKIINQGGLKSGTVKISQIIKSEVNIQSATLEEILEDFELKEKYLMIAPDQITIQENIDSEANQEEVKIERIEYITSFEKSGSYYFVIKLGQITREKSRSQNSRSSSPLKPSPFENKNGSYLIELIDKKEAADWETVFSFINFKALARKGNLQQNRIDFINSLKLFLSRYADCNGDNVLIFGDTFHVHSEKQNLNPSISNISKHSQSFDPIPEILHETSQTTEHEPIEIPEPDVDSEETNKRTLQLQPVEPESKKSSPATQKSVPAQEEDDDDEQVIRERDSEDEEDGEMDPDEMMPETNVQEEMIFSIGDEALALEDNKNSSIYQDTRRETVSKENQEFSKNLTSLLEGFTLEKYGKWGTKREKLVRVSNDFTGLEWRDLKKPKRLPDSISVDSIERIEVAGRSSYFQKKKMADGELNLCVSVISTEREVNLKAPDLKNRENFVSSLQIILNERVKLQKLATHVKAERDRDLKREKY